jgi:hypothetical protein
MHPQLHTKRPPRPQRGIGAFAHLESPQDPSSAIATDLKDSLSDQPGLRLGAGPAARIFFGGALTPQRFTRPPAETNDADAVRAATLHVNAPRLFTKTRGQVANLSLQTGVGE